MAPHDLAAALTAVQQRVAHAARQAARNPDTVTLVAVSKTHPPQAIRDAYALGQRHFGENYAQELRNKAAELQDLVGLRWHFLGPLQRNKVKYVVGVAQVFHALDRLDLAAELGARAQSLGRVQDVLVEVNVGKETTKHGVAPADLDALVEKVRSVPGVNVRGLMCIPPPRDRPEQTRQDFLLLWGCAQRLGLPELSMGMSADFEEAIGQGATLVRVGTAIFGQRNKREHT